MSLALSTILTAQNAKRWHDIVTLDESWFYFSTDYETIWLPSDVPLPERERLSIKSRKMMITIVWSPVGFIRIAALPKGGKFNSDYYISDVLKPLVLWRAIQPGDNRQRLFVHADNARPHTSKKVKDFFDNNGLQVAPHPPYSPDLAPCDFYLFGYIKSQLKGQTFEEPKDLLRAVRTVCEGISKATLLSTFRNWIQRLQTCHSSHGELVRDS
jgi:transposase